MNERMNGLTDRKRLVTVNPSQLCLVSSEGKVNRRTLSGKQTQTSDNRGCRNAKKHQHERHSLDANLFLREKIEGSL